MRGDRGGCRWYHAQIEMVLGSLLSCKRGLYHRVRVEKTGRPPQCPVQTVTQRIVKVVEEEVRRFRPPSTSRRHEIVNYAWRGSCSLELERPSARSKARECATKQILGVAVATHITAYFAPCKVVPLKSPRVRID